MIPIDWEIVDSLLEAGCDGVQVSAYLGCHPETLYDRCKDEKKTDFSAYKAEKRAKGDVRLLSAQFDAAIKDRDKTMMIWLGKQRLDQSEKQKTDLNHSGGVTMIWQDAESGESYNKENEGIKQEPGSLPIEEIQGHS